MFKTEATRTRINGQTSFAMLFADDLKLSRAAFLDPALYPSKPIARLLEENPGLYPLQHNHNRGLWKDGLWLQGLRFKGGASRDDDETV